MLKSDSPSLPLRDPLTGAYTRAFFDQCLADELTQARHHQHQLTIFVIDVDYFKSINDSFGHAFGDQVLREFVARASSVLRATDFLCRMGGDEFVLVLGGTPMSQAFGVMTRLIEIIQGAPFQGVTPIHLTLSVGGAAFPADGETAGELFGCADHRLYAAKRRGRACMVVDDSPGLPELDFAGDARLIERDAMLQSARAFLSELAYQRRGLLTITGPAGCGLSRFLAEVGSIFGRQDFAVLKLYPRRALRSRQYGVLDNLAPPWDSLGKAGDLARLLTAIPEQIGASGQGGLLVTVDHLPDLDAATAVLLRHLLASATPLPIAVAYTTRSEMTQRALEAEVPLSFTIELTPFSQQGTLIWVRGILKWEPPASLVAWLYEQTGGLPALLRRGLVELVAQGTLVRNQAEGWQVRNAIDSFPLRERLRQLAQPLRCSLPSYQTTFVGRAEEIQRLKALIEQSPLVTVTGLGGVGKTRLVTQTALEMLDEFEHGIALVPLRDVRDAELVPTLALRHLGVTPGERETPRSQLLAYLRPRRLLLIFDTLEHLPDVIELLGAILRHVPEARLVVTSRERLQIAHEVVLDLRGLAVPSGDDSVSIAASAAAQLFIQQVSLHRTGSGLSHEDWQAAGRISRFVEGLPLAIELAAAWAASLSAADVADAITRAVDGLTVSRKVQPGVQAVLDYFWGSLAPHERRVLRAFSVFFGGFTSEAAQRVAGASIFFLSALVDKAFITRNESGRYDMHQLLRQYTAEQLARHPREEQRAQRRLARYYTTLAERAAPHLIGVQQELWLDRLEQELANLRAAMEWALASGEPALALRLSGALERFWHYHSHLGEGRRWLAAALAHSGPPGTALSPPLRAARARALNGAGALAWLQSDYAAALPLLEESLQLWQSQGNQAQIAAVLNDLGLVYRDLGDFQRALPCFEASLTIRRGRRDRRGMAMVLISVGELILFAGEPARARPLNEEALALCRRYGGKWDICMALYHHGELLFYLPSLDLARAAFEESLQLRDEVSDRMIVSLTLCYLGRITAHDGDYSLARRLLRESFALIREVDDPASLILVLLGLIELASAQGHPHDAALLLGLLQRTCDQIGSPLAPLYVRQHAAMAEDISARVGVEAYQAALATGYGLDLEQAAALSVLAADYEAG